MNPPVLTNNTFSDVDAIQASCLDHLEIFSLVCINTEHSGSCWFSLAASSIEKSEYKVINLKPRCFVLACEPMVM